MVMRWRRCKNNGIVKRNGKWYCGVHDPEKVDEHWKKLDENRREKRDREKKLHMVYLKAKQNRK